MEIVEYKDMLIQLTLDENWPRVDFQIEERSADPFIHNWGLLLMLGKHDNNHRYSVQQRANLRNTGVSILEFAIMDKAHFVAQFAHPVYRRMLTDEDEYVRCRAGFALENHEINPFDVLEGYEVFKYNLGTILEHYSQIGDVMELAQQKLISFNERMRNPELKWF